MKKRILLTGGGTAGHVTPHLALLPNLLELGYEIHYIGSHTGIEREILATYDLTYHPISSGKLRRYFSTKNFTDPFRVLKGFFQASKLIKEIQPEVIFSKGGFVSVPVVMAGKRHKIPTLIHESDMTPGLANRLSIPSATKVFCNFPETLNHLPKEKAVVSGSPIRRELFTGVPAVGKEFCQFHQDKPVLFISGGSLGSAIVNQAIRNILPALLTDFQVIHLCGKGKVDTSLTNLVGYAQFEYVDTQMKDILATSNLVIARAGANSICEFLALKKPNLLIPLSAKASRGDQILNAKSFVKQGFSLMIEEEELNDELLLSTIHNLYQNRQTYIDTMTKTNQSNGVNTILDAIIEASK